MSYRCKNEAELDRLSDDELIAEIIAARDAGDNDCARKVLGVLAFRRYDDVRRRVQLKVPEADVEDVAMEGLSSAIKSAFDGTSVGEFVNWLNRITSRRIADYHRSRPDETDVPLAEEQNGEDDTRGVQLSEDDFSDRVDTEDVVEQALSDLSRPHRAVVEHYVFGGLKAKETAEQVNISFGDELPSPMTEANVHQIGKRFRDRLRELLEGSGDD